MITPAERGLLAPGRIFLFSHYQDKSAAQAHFNAISADKYRYVYDWEVKEDKNKLLIAASQPKGFKIYSCVLASTAKPILAQAQRDVTDYVEHTLRWARGGQPIKCDLYVEHGEFYVRLKWGMNKEQLKLADIKIG